MERLTWRKSLKSLERVKGIEPSSSAWKAVALPLSYTRTRGQKSEIGNQKTRMRSRPNLLITDNWPLVGGGGRTRTYEGVSQRIYSPPPLPLGTLPRARTSHPADARSGRVMGSARRSVNRAEPAAIP
jgi:hypothetical protein